MKTIKQFLNWLFADLLFYLYELAEAKFTLNAAPTLTKKRRAYLATQPIVISVSTARNLVVLGAVSVVETSDGNVPQYINSNGRVYGFYDIQGDNVIYLLGRASSNLLGIRTANQTNRVTLKWSDR